MHRVVACLALGFSGCYSRPAVDDGGPVSDTSDSDATATVGETGPSTSDTAPTTTAPTTTSPSTTATTASATVDPDSSSGNTELGPQIMMSVPSDGDMNGPLDPYFLLYFDRVVGVNDAVGKISVSQDGGPPAFVSPLPCPPDADPTCIAGQYPESFTDPATGRLPPNAAHTVTVAADFPDPDGLVNTLDQSIAFTTFDFTAEFFDDGNALGDEVGGLAYDPGSASLFLVGLTPGQGDPLVRRIPIPGGVAGAASTVASPVPAGGGPYAYGVDAFDGQLYVSLSYGGDVRRYSNLDSASLEASEEVIGTTTGLAAPNDTLLQVQSVAVSGDVTYFARGYYLATDPAYEILAQAELGSFSIYESGANLWDDDDFYGANIVTGTVDGTETMFVAASRGLFKFRVADGALLGSIEPDFALFSADLHLDGDGHLFVGSDDGVVVYDAVSDDFALVTERRGLEASRIALREEGNTVHVYYLRFRGDPVIGHLAIEF